MAPEEEHSKQRKQSKGHVWGTARRVLEGTEKVLRREKDKCRRKGERGDEAMGAL